MFDPKHNFSRFKDYFIPALILLSGLFVSGTIFWKNNATEKTIPGTILPINTSQERADIKINSSDPIIGNPKASITFVEFYDFQCGYCKLFAQQTLPKIIEKYIKTGKVKIVFKDLINQGEDSVQAAVSANCAFEQNKFIDYHNEIFALGDFSKIPTKEELLNIAQKLNLNVFKFNSCLSNTTTREDIEQDTKEGKLAGATGTPTIFINGIKIVGAQNFSIYETVIEQELRGAVSK